MKRYNSVYAGSYTKPHEMVEENDGDWVWFEDVENLQDLHAALSVHAMKMLEALRYVATPEDDDDPAEVRRMALAAVRAFMNDTRFWYAVDLEDDSHHLPGVLPT